MLWLIVAILSYFLFAISALIDKYLLGGLMPSPRAYSFYVGVLGILSLILIPFVNFIIPDLLTILLSLLAGFIFFFSLFGLFSALSLFEASRIVPAIGGVQPLFIFGLTYIFSRGEEMLSLNELLAFFVLVVGSVLITLGKEKSISIKGFKIACIASLLGALYLVLSKYVYLAQPFWSGLIWMRIGAFLAALLFLFSEEVRNEIFLRKISFEKKTIGIFLSSPIMGSGANILQNFAIFLAPLAYVAIINSLLGIEYVFLLIFTVLISLKFPQILKEEISRKVLIQKIVAILLIGGGIAILAFK